MEICLKKEEYRSLENICECVIEECVQAELSLPEYMPEILRIVRSSAEVKINSCGCVGERCTVDGECELRMVYTADDGSVVSFSQTRPFTRYCDNKAFAEADDVRADKAVSYVNCRATNPRRAEIKAGITVTLAAFAAVTQSIAVSCDSDLVQQKSLDIHASSLGCVCSRSFSMSDTCELKNGAALYILSTKTAAITGETRKTGNKLMINGEATVEICYVPAADRTVSETVRHSMPVSQVLEFEGLRETYNGETVLRVDAADIIIKNGPAGEGSAFDISLGITAAVTMWEQKDISLISDAYSVEGEPELEKKRVVFLTAADEVRENRNFRETVDFSKSGIGEIIDFVYENINVKAVTEGALLKISGALKLSFILRDQSGETVTDEKVTDYCFEHRLSEEIADAYTLPSVTVCAVDCIRKNSNQAEIRAELRVVCPVFEKNGLDVITDIKIKETPQKKRKSSLTVYFPQSEESLWDIARRYNTTVDAVAGENGITGETTGELKMIFIPVV